jgi:hypothetical protein
MGWDGNGLGRDRSPSGEIGVGSGFSARFTR